jgi:hypothetical protein
MYLVGGGEAGDVGGEMVEVDPSGEVKEEWTNNMNPKKKNWRKFGGMIMTFH